MSSHTLDHEDDRARGDDIVILRQATWADFQRLLEMRGDRSIPRICYLEGEIELMSPSQDHERIKAIIGRLVEAWCMENEVEFSPVGSWTLEKKEAERGVEPDECYIFGSTPDAPQPDLAIEVVWTRGGLNKLEIYRKLGVREVWYWRNSRITVWALRGERYDEVERSTLLPAIDLAQIASFVDRPRITTSRIIREYRATLAKPKKPRRKR